LRVGAVTVGPPVSVQVRCRLRSSPSPPSLQRISTRPSLVDSAPYFAAFVHSSCRAIAIARAALDPRRTGGPSIRSRLRPPECGLMVSVTTARPHVMVGQPDIWLGPMARTDRAWRGRRGGPALACERRCSGSNACTGRRRGVAPAISPDLRWMATGDESSAVTIWSLNSLP
jgi:hypothetical protein